MQRLGLYDFYALFEDARSFALVGNAGTVLDYENGALIDSHDVVVRFNCAYTSGIEAKVGARTDILCANIGRSLDNCPSPATTLRPRAVVCFGDRSPRDGDCRPDGFVEWVGDLPALITWAPDLIGIGQGKRTRQLTQGTYMLFTLLRLFRVERLFVTGFTMYQPVAGSPMSYHESSPLSAGLSHDLDEETRILVAMLDSFEGELTATPETKALLAQRRDGSGTVRPGFLGRAEGSAPIRWHERLRGWVAWSLIRAGLGLRRGLETNTVFDFAALQEGRPPPPPPPPPPKKHVRRHKKRNASALK